MPAQPKSRVTPSESRLSRSTLELCDWLIDGVTIAANHPEFEREATKVGTAKREVARALRATGGTPIGDTREPMPKP